LIYAHITSRHIVAASKSVRHNGPIVLCNISEDVNNGKKKIKSLLHKMKNFILEQKDSARR